MTELALATLVATTLMTPAPSGRPASDAAHQPETILVLDFEVRDQGVHTGDDREVASVAREATRLYRKRVEEDGRFTLAVGEESGATADPAPGTRGSSCRTATCTRELARRTGATLVIRGRYVKVSNLIRYLAVELVDPSTGRVVRSAAAEIKGQRDVVLPRAVANLYDHLHPGSGGPGSVHGT